MNSDAGLYGYGYGTIANGNFDEAVSKACANGLAALKGVALFFAAPFFGLAYILVFPLVGLGMAVWFGGKALLKYGAARQSGGSRKAGGNYRRGAASRPGVRDAAAVVRCRDARMDRRQGRRGVTQRRKIRSCTKEVMK